MTPPEVYPNELHTFAELIKRLVGTPKAQTRIVIVVETDGSFGITVKTKHPKPTKPPEPPRNPWLSGSSGSEAPGAKPLDWLDQPTRDPGGTPR